MTGTKKTKLSSRKCKKENRIGKKLALYQASMENGVEEILDPVLGDIVLIQPPTFESFCIQYVNSVQETFETTRRFTVKIPRYQILNDGHVYYMVQVITCGGDMVYTAKKRYSEFYKLAGALRDNDLMLNWTIPPKTWFSKTDEEFLNARKVELNDSLQKLLNVVCLEKSILLRDFLSLDAFCSLSQHGILKGCN